MSFNLTIKNIIAGALHQVSFWRCLSYLNVNTVPILTYHRVIESDLVNYPIQPGMFVRPETFWMQMKYLSKNCEVLSLPSYLDALDSGRILNKNSIVVTFDDGWIDTYSNAFDILKEFSIPATVFLATAYIGTGDCFWSDDIARSIFSLWKQPETNKSVNSRLLESDIASEDHRGEIYFILGLENSTDLKIHLDKFIEKLKLESNAERANIKKLLRNLAREFSHEAFDPLFLNWEQVLEMQKSRVSFGSHSHQHQQLNELTVMQVKDEVSNSLQILKARGVIPVRAFCYPGGYHNDTTQDALKDSGIDYALTVRRASDLKSVPRLLGRINIHQDISSTEAMFAARIWGRGAF
jgi:peptidoglycan/xylan/chitin deacetylase (PgdA/CDA1 family)